MKYVDAKKAEIIKSKELMAKNGATVKVEHWVTQEVPPSICYRATCGDTVMNHSMTVHADRVKTKDEIKADHDAEISKLVEQAAIHEEHRTHVEQL